jgi:hypothetical protein
MDSESVFVDISPMSECHDDHEQDIVDNCVDDPVVPHPHPISGSTAQRTG